MDIDGFNEASQAINLLKTLKKGLGDMTKDTTLLESGEYGISEEDFEVIQHVLEVHRDNCARKEKEA